MIISIFFDTKTKKSTVNVDGQPLSNVESVTISRMEYEEGGEKKETSMIDLVTREILSDDKVCKKTVLYASEIKEDSLSIDKLEVYIKDRIDNVLKATTSWLVNFGK